MIIFTKRNGLAEEAQCHGCQSRLALILLIFFSLGTSQDLSVDTIQDLRQSNENAIKNIGQMPRVRQSMHGRRYFEQFVQFV